MRLTLGITTKYIDRNPAGFSLYRFFCYPGTLPEAFSTTMVGSRVMCE
jgi:hypothetical protein